MVKGEQEFEAWAPACPSWTLCSDSHVTQPLLTRPDHPAPALHPKVPPGSAPPQPRTALLAVPLGARAGTQSNLQQKGGE